MRGRDIILAVLVLYLSAAMQLASADGFIIPEPMPELRIPPQLSVKYHYVNVTIGGSYAQTAVDQVFLNDAPYDLEGTYIFPLPSDASVSAFSMYADGEELSGRVLDKDEARQTYEQIVRRLKDPALLEYVGEGMFRARVYPIPAARSGVPGEKRIKLSYEQLVSCGAGVCRFSYPLNTEKFSSAPLQSVSVSVRIKSERQIKSVYSPTHDIATNRISDYEVSASFEASNVRPDKDFILYYTLSEEDIGISLLTYRAAGEDGFFMLLASPRYGQNKTVPKDIVFVLDTSGSMAGEKLAQAKGALRFCLNNLNADDRFDVVSFNSDVKAFSPSLEAASLSNVKGALAFTDGLQAAGGTDINSALQSALKLTENGSQRPRMIIFLTDGLPTVGMTEVDRILGNVASAGDNSTRIFSFGVGFDVNTHLLDQLSARSSGVSEYVEPGEDIESIVSSFYAKVKYPVLSGLRLAFSNVSVNEVYPKQLPDLFSGSQLIVFGRYAGGGGSLINLFGSDGEEKKSFSYEVSFASEESRNDFIPRLWASRKIGYLLDEIRLNGEDEELVDEIIRLSLAYGIMTPYTSFLVDADKSNGAPIRQEEVRDMFYEALSGASFKSSTGAAAVNSAESVRQLKDSDVEVSSAEVKMVGAKVFYLTDGVWVDNDYSAGKKTTDVVYGSDSYFSMLDGKSDVGKYLSLGPAVRFCLGDACFDVGEDGETDAPVTVPTTEHTLRGSGAGVSATTQPGNSLPAAVSPNVSGSDVLYSTFLVVGSIIFLSATILFLGRRGK